MNMIVENFAIDQNSNLVEVLTSECGRFTIGYRFGGHSAGPDMLAVGFAPIADIVFGRLVQLPTLGWLRGSLTLLDLSALDNAGENAKLAAHLQPKPDRFMFLPYAARSRAIEDIEQLANQGYWKVLRQCARIGMISGRGVRDAHREEEKVT